MHSPLNVKFPFWMPSVDALCSSFISCWPDMLLRFIIIIIIIIVSSSSSLYISVTRSLYFFERWTGIELMNTFLVFTEPLCSRSEP